MDDLFISDLDGTLLNDNQEMDTETIEALNALIDRGMNFTIATARSYDSVHYIIKGLNLKLPIILMNGVFIFDTQSKINIVSNYLSNSLANSIVQLHLKHKLNPFVYTIDAKGEPKIYYRGIHNESEANYVNNRLSKGDRRFTLVHTYDECLTEKIMSVNVIDEPHKLEESRIEFESNAECVCHFGPDIYTPHYHWLEISSHKATKKNAVLYLKETYKAKKLICFGDNLNDLSMFEVSDEKYAVKNAHAEIIHAADKVIGSNNENGVSTYLVDRFCQKTDANING